MNCPICEKKMEKVKEPYSYGNVKLGEFKAEKCSNCNEVFFTEEASDKIDEKAKCMDNRTRDKGESRG